MINLINGSLRDPQEKITWVENKPSATVILNTHTWTEGETLIVGYKSLGGGREIMIGLGIGRGVGPSFYRVVIDKSVVVVTEVLKEVPDVSYYAFDQRYLVREGGALYFTRRYLDTETGKVTVERVEAKNKCMVIEASTGDIWICNPPEITNFYTTTTRPSIGEITDMGGGQIKIDISGDGQVWKNLCFVSPEEKQYLTEMVFGRNFEVSVKGERLNFSGIPVDSRDPCVVRRTAYTLNTKYSGELIDLDEIPWGWTRLGEGIYKKIIIGGTTSSSGPISCKLTVSGYTGVKTHPGLSVVVDRYIFILYSEEAPEGIQEGTRGILASTPKVGTITVTPPHGSYVWIAFPESFRPSGITQLGVGYVSKDTTTIQGVTKGGVDLGGYVVYKSLNPGNGESQDIVIE